MTYEQAFREATDRANRTRHDIGLSKNSLFGTFEVFVLPRPENRCGHELRCQVVRPDPRPSPDAAPVVRL